MAERTHSDGRPRLDRWLWAARFFKTRTLATTAVTGGHVHVAGARTKPSRPVRMGDEITITRGRVTWTVLVTGMSDKRGSATAAALLYEETEDSRSAREAAAEQHRAEKPPDSPLVAGRPTKRDRRLMDRLRRRR